MFPYVLFYITLFVILISLSHHYFSTTSSNCSNVNDIWKLTKVELSDGEKGRDITKAYDNVLSASENTFHTKQLKFHFAFLKKGLMPSRVNANTQIIITNKSTKAITVDWANIKLITKNKHYDILDSKSIYNHDSMKTIYPRTEHDVHVNLPAVTILSTVTQKRLSEIILNNQVNDKMRLDIPIVENHVLHIYSFTFVLTEREIVPINGRVKFDKF